MSVVEAIRRMKEEAKTKGIETEVLEDIGDGRVERITLSSKGEESTGFLFVDPKVTIYQHGHSDRISEVYELILGEVEVNSLVMTKEKENSHCCLPGETHYLKNLSDQPSIVRFTKKYSGK